ncbi:citrate synthase [Ruania alkalisoli]|uniref:citrate synthase (unknown stereospecificity) n=1 Tax=Ruania alkalisoli TaxID=2779775 RepID=A0A7M1SVN0_9MICO|nr:citrate synthase [Ruania alkalisoli]QOR71521.1 citrate synthase [Ruania alkalisoli]
MTAPAPISSVDPERGLYFRGRDVRDLVARGGFEDVWGLLVDGAEGRALPPAEPFPLTVRTGDHRVDVQSALAQLAPVWGFRPIGEVDRDQLRSDLARASVMALSFVAQSARNDDLPAIGQRQVNTVEGTARRFVMRWRGEVDDAHARAIDACWVALAEHGLTSSTTVARQIARTGADAAACLSGAVAAVSGPRGGGAAVRALALIREAEHTGDPRAVVERTLDAGALYGFHQDGYHGTDPRVEALREVVRSLGAPRLEIADAVARAGYEALAARGIRPAAAYGGHALFWASVLLDLAQVPPPMFTAMIACGRVAGWSAHILEAHDEMATVR